MFVILFRHSRFRTDALALWRSISGAITPLRSLSLRPAAVSPVPA
jgi:hypothetical protein